MEKSDFFVPEAPGARADTLPVYKISYETAENRAQELAAIFGVKGEVQRTDGMELVTDGARSLAHYPQTGAFWYYDTEKIDAPAGAKDLPDEKTARKLAIEFLREHDWLPEHFDLDAVAVAQTETVQNGEKLTQDSHVCVSFRPHFDKIEGYGPGGKIKVFLGQEGRVIGVVRAVGSAHVHAKYPIVPADEVRKRLERRLGQPLGKLKLTQAKTVYHAESMVVASPYMQPAYLFEFESEVPSHKSDEVVAVPFELRPFPATRFAPLVSIDAAEPEMEVRRGDRISLKCEIVGGTEPYDIEWSSDYDGVLGEGRLLDIDTLSIAHRQGRVLPHVITAKVTDRNGMTDVETLLVTVKPAEKVRKLAPKPDEEGPDPYVGVEWCNVYGSPGLAHISGTDDSAQGFKSGIAALSGWSSRFDWGNGAAWEQDFKRAGAPGGGTDTYWADNVHFAFFAGHGSSGRFWFGSTVDDHEMRAQDAEWGDGHLNWIVLHACQTMRSNFAWTTWCDAFNGLHQMFGFHTNAQGSNPPLGTRFALWSRLSLWPFTGSLFDLRTAWRIACQECYDSSREYAMIYANQSGTDTANDHLPGYGFVSSDPSSPTSWVYTKGTC